MLVTLYLARVCAWQKLGSCGCELDYLVNAEFYTLVTYTGGTRVSVALNTGRIGADTHDALEARGAF